mgnify:CR=1 FL=1
MSSPAAEQEMTTDVVILGAGPTGLYGAYYAGFRGLSTIVVDVLPQVGGQVIALYPEKQIRDVAGIPTVRGRDFVTDLKTQADAFAPTYLLGRQAVSIDHVDGQPVITLDDQTVIRAGALVITAGIGKCRTEDGQFVYPRWATEGMPQLSPLWLLKYLPNLPASHVAIFNDLHGPNNSLTVRLPS